jgi:hypothetical protein
MGMRQISEEPCLLSMSFLFFLFFVDDIITLYHPENRSQVISFMESLRETFDVKDMGELK